MSPVDTRYNIVMFAYNEGENLRRSVPAVWENTDENLNAFFLIANGCTDATVVIAEELREKLDFESMQVIDIPVADKCNAWNTYVHEIARADIPCHFFVDADVRFSENCFPMMAEVLCFTQPSPSIIAGMPLSGRNVAFYQSLVRERSCFFGNLYGMHREYLALLRNKRFRLPAGLNWIDSFLTKAANTDLMFTSDNLPDRVTFLEGAGFRFDSLSPFRWTDIKLYKNRIARYELGKLQETFLDRLPLAEWPESMDGINGQIDSDFDALAAGLGPIKRFLVRRRLSRMLARQNSDSGC